MDTPNAAARQQPAADRQALGPVVVGTDGSHHALKAVLWAAREATVRGRPLTVVHSTGADRIRHLTPEGAALLLDEGHRLLERAAAEVRTRHPGLQVETLLSRSEPAEGILEAAGADGTAVVGSRGQGGFAALLVGSVGLRVCARAQGPVVVVREVPEPPEGVVLVAVRDDGDRDALRFAARTAQLRGSSLRALSTWMFLESAGRMAPMVDDVSAVSAAEVAATTRTVDPIRREFPDLPITEDLVRSTSVAGSLVRASATADLLVMGAHRPAHARGARFGRVTHAALHHAHCPVAVVHRP